MVSTRSPLLWLIVPLAAHVVIACDKLQKGNTERIIVNTKTFNADLPPDQDRVFIDVSPFGKGTGVSGVEVEGCLYNFSENTNVHVSYKGRRLSFARQLDSDSLSDINFSITVYYVPLIPEAEFLEEGTIGFYEGK